MPYFVKTETIKRHYLSEIDFKSKTIKEHKQWVKNLIDQGLLTILQNCRKQVVVVVHCNHAQEIDAAVASACQRLKTINVTLLNQSVLLKGVNDDAKTLINLSEQLFACGVLPYYLHRLDQVAGAAHFDVSKNKQMQIIAQMRRELSGYLMPKFVEEIAGDTSKRLIL